MALLIPKQDTVQVKRVQVGADTLLPEAGTVTFPYEQVTFPNGFSPLDLANLNNRLDGFALNANGTVNSTLAGLRSLETPDATLFYATTDADPRFPWYYDPTDTTSLDDTGLTLVSQTGKRYKRLVLDYVDVSWFGVTPVNGAVSAAPDLAIVVELLLPIMSQRYAGKFVRVPNGTYRWSKRVLTHPFSLDLRCTDGQATLQTTPEVSQLLWVVQPVHCSHITFSSQTGAPVLDGSGNPSQNPDDYNEFSNVYVSRRSTFEYCEFVNSRGHGCYFNGNVGYRNEYFPNGSDCSLSVFRYCKFNFNRGCGRYIDRDAGSYDANQIEFYNCDQRDNGLVGAWDGSFLGCQQKLGHYNNNVLGHQKITNPNNISWAEGVYEEDGSPASEFIGRGSQFGCRLTGNPFVDLFFCYNFGSQFSALRVQALTIQYGGKGFAIQGNGQEAPILRQHHLNVENYTQMVWSNTNSDSDWYSQHFAVGSRLSTPGKPYFREAHSDGFSFIRLYQGGHFNVVEWAESLADVGLSKTHFLQGDVVKLYQDDGSRPEYYRCVSGGYLFNTGTAYPGVTVSVPIGVGGQPRTSVTPTMFREGDHLVINGQTGRILSIDLENKVLNTDAQFPDNISGATVYTATAKFMAEGRGRGPKSRLPVAYMTPESAGWEYYATDENQYYTWTGTTFLARP